MNKNIYINMDQEIKQELRKACGESSHQMVQGAGGQYVDAHVNMDEPQLRELGQAQVEALLVFQTDSETLHLIEKMEIEAEVLDRIQWGKKKKKRKKVAY